MIMFFCIGTILTLLLFYYDKMQAKAHQWRIPEWVLLISVLFFGTIGGVLGMIFFRHKTKKRSFQMKFFLVVVIQFAFLYLLLTVD